MSFRQYSGANKIFNRYWYVYGGTCDVITSPYFGLALILTILIFIISWPSTPASYEVALSVIPNLLGFTLGGYVVMFSFGDSGFLSVIAGEIESENARSSPLVAYAARYMHFLVIQCACLMFAVFQNAIYKDCDLGDLFEWKWKLFVVFNFAEYILLNYALSLALATTAGIFRTALRFDKFICVKKRIEREKAARDAASEKAKSTSDIPS